MLLPSNSIDNSQTLVAVLRNFGIALKNQPGFPISLPSLIQFLREEGVAATAIEAFTSHVGRNSELYGPLARDRVDAHVWPNPTKEPYRTAAEELFWSKRTPIITRQSKIVSLGSCFAVELAKWLQVNGYNYVVKELNFDKDTNLHRSSARWGTIFNAIGFQQVVKWAFDLDRPPLVAYRSGDKIRDPFREDIVYTEDEVPQLERLWREHTACTRAALEEADVVVLTVGLNEVFRYLPTGHYLHRNPWGMNPALWSPQILSVEDNVYVLRKAIEALRSFNPKVKLIISVSPVPLVRTFRRDVHVAAATAHSKAVLRVAIEQLCSSVSDVFYMSSFETVMYPGTRTNIWRPDQRHVSVEIVEKIMRLFQQQFCSLDDGLQAARAQFASPVPGVNPSFATDHEILCETAKECVDRKLTSAAEALDMVNYCTRALYTDEADQRAYELLRKYSTKSRFIFNTLARDRYRKAFPTHFRSTPQSDIIFQGLSEQGYYVAPATSQTRNYAEHLLTHLRPLPVTREVDGKVGLFEDLIAEDLPGAFRFNVTEEDIPAAPIVALLEEAGVLRAIGEDIGHPILRRLSVRHSTRPSRFDEKDQSRAAMFFHADNNNPTGWIKVFIYLTDVTDENGPHVFVPGSHSERPAQLARDGRFTEDEIKHFYRPAVTFTGPAGTIIVENTLGMHKGLTVRSGTRSVLQFECVNSLLGKATKHHKAANRVLLDLSQYDERFLHRYIRDSRHQR